jgi:hypothetical protein
MAQLYQDQADKEDISHDLVADNRVDGIEMLDPKGDLLLAVGQRHLPVSSKVLELSCPLFQKNKNGSDRTVSWKASSSQILTSHPSSNWMKAIRESAT